MYFAAGNEFNPVKFNADEWVAVRRNEAVYGVVLTRLDRVEGGNLGDCAPVGWGVHELKIDFGPGYRVYFGEDGEYVILLGGGKKKTQGRDIVTAKEKVEGIQCLSGRPAINHGSQRT